MPHQVALSSSGVSIFKDACGNHGGLRGAKRRAQHPDDAKALFPPPAVHHADENESGDKSCPASPATVIGSPLIRQGGAVSDSFVGDMTKPLSAPSTRNSKKNKLTFKT